MLMPSPELNLQYGRKKGNVWFLALNFATSLLMQQEIYICPENPHGQKKGNMSHQRLLMLRGKHSEYEKIDTHHKNLCHPTQKLIFFKMFHFYLDNDQGYRFHIKRNGRIKIFFLFHTFCCLYQLKEFNISSSKIQILSGDVRKRKNKEIIPNEERMNTQNVATGTKHPLVQVLTFEFAGHLPSFLIFI